MRLLVDILNNKNLKINKLHKPNRNKGGINEKKRNNILQKIS